jgi:hypothetical protein
MGAQHLGALAVAGFVPIGGGDHYAGLEGDRYAGVQAPSASLRSARSARGLCISNGSRRPDQPDPINASGASRPVGTSLGVAGGEGLCGDLVDADPASGGLGCHVLVGVGCRRPPGTARRRPGEDCLVTDCSPQKAVAGCTRGAAPPEPETAPFRWSRLPAIMAARSGRDLSRFGPISRPSGDMKPATVATGDVVSDMASGSIHRGWSRNVVAAASAAFAMTGRIVDGMCRTVLPGDELADAVVRPFDPQNSRDA